VKYIFDHGRSSTLALKFLRSPWRLGLSYPRDSYLSIYEQCAFAVLLWSNSDILVQCAHSAPYTSPNWQAKCCSTHPHSTDHDNLSFPQVTLTSKSYPYIKTIFYILPFAQSLHWCAVLALLPMACRFPSSRSLIQMGLLVHSFTPQNWQSPRLDRHRASD
jgi:hypothetical protein